MTDHGNNLSMLVGKTLANIRSTDDEILFVCTDGDAFMAYHMQDCCECVAIYDVTGDLQSLVGATIASAIEEENRTDWPSDVPDDGEDSFTWTTHKFRTQSGSEVVVRWLGVSNGYYDENVYFNRTHKPVAFATP